MAATETGTGKGVIEVTLARFVGETRATVEVCGGAKRWRSHISGVSQVSVIVLLLI